MSKYSRADAKAYARATQQKLWQDLLGQVGGNVRPPMLELSEAERAAVRAASLSVDWPALAGPPEPIRGEYRHAAPQAVQLQGVDRRA